MGRTYETVIRLSAELSRTFRATTGGATAALKKLEAEAKKLKAASAAADRFVKLEAQLREAEKALADAGGASDKLRRAVERKSAALAKASERARKLGVDTAHLGREQQRLAGDLARTESRLRGLSLIAGAKLGERFGKVQQQARSAAADFARFGVVAGAAAAVPLVQFAKFQKGMAEVSTLVDTSTVDMGALTEQVRALSKEYGADHVVTAKALYQTLSSGVTNSADAMRVLNVANRLAVAGVTDVDVAVDGLTTVVNAFGMGAAGAARASDILVTTMRLAKTTIPELSQFMFQAAPMAANLGVSLEEVNAGVVALTLQGTPTAEAMTRIRAAMTGLVRPSKEITALWKSLGFNSGTAAIQSLGLAGALRAVAKHVGGDAGRMSEMLGGIEGVQAAMVIAGTGAAAFDDALKQMGESSGATDTAFAKMAATVDFKSRIIKAKALDIAITLGSRLAPVAEKTLTRISAWVDENKDRIEEWATRAGQIIETEFVPGLQKAAAEVWPVVKGMAQMIARISEAVGGWGNFALVAAGLRLAPLALSIGQLGVGLVSAAAGATRIVLGMRGIQATATATVGALGPLIAALTAGLAAGKALDEWLGISDAFGELANPEMQQANRSFDNWVRGQDIAVNRGRAAGPAVTVAPTINVESVDQAKAALQRSTDEAKRELDRRIDDVARARRRRSNG